MFQDDKITLKIGDKKKEITLNENSKQYAQKIVNEIVFMYRQFIMEKQKDMKKIFHNREALNVMLKQILNDNKVQEVIDYFTEEEELQESYNYTPEMIENDFNNNFYEPYSNQSMLKSYDYSNIKKEGLESVLKSYREKINNFLEVFPSGYEAQNFIQIFLELFDTYDPENQFSNFIRLIAGLPELIYRVNHYEVNQEVFQSFKDLIERQDQFIKSLKKQLIKVGQEVDKNHKFYEEEILGDERKIYPEKNNNNVQSNYELEEENTELKRRCEELENAYNELINQFDALDRDYNHLHLILNQFKSSDIFFFLELAELVLLVS